MEALDDNRILEERASQYPRTLPKTSQSSFSPFLVQTLKPPVSYGFYNSSVCYSPRHNMIIACPFNRTMQFYDAVALSPFEVRETQKLQGAVMNMSFHAETDTYIMGCTDGYIYVYNAFTYKLKLLRKCERHALTVTFIDNSSYIFSSIGSQRLFLGTLQNEDVVSFDSHNSDAWCLQHVTQRNLLISGLINGSVMVYRTDKLPRLQVFCSVQAHSAGIFVLTAQRITIHKKEYVITAGQECNVKIWHLVKGRMGLLRVIRTKEIPYSVVYLEDYKLLAIASECNYVNFFRLPFGILENTVYLAENDVHSLFLMKEKNMIGVTTYQGKLIEFIQLSGEKKI